MERLVTALDLEKNPELIKQGVSINQHYNFPDEENSQAENHLNTPTEVPKKQEPKPVAKKAAPKKVAPKKSAAPKKTAPAPKIIAPKIVVVKKSSKSK